jgi:hypothetical protein
MRRCWSAPEPLSGSLNHGQYPGTHPIFLRTRTHLLTFAPLDFFACLHTLPFPLFQVCEDGFCPGEPPRYGYMALPTAEQVSAIRRIYLEDNETLIAIIR